MSTTTTTTATPAITAENVTTLFPDVDPSLAQAVSRTQNGPTAREDGELEGYDEEQIRLMDEVCIVLDENDQPIGSASKKTCLCSPSPPHDNLVLCVQLHVQIFRWTAAVWLFSRFSVSYPMSYRGRCELTLSKLCLTHYRPFDDQYRARASSPCLLRFPFRFSEEIVTPTARIRENHFPRYVDQYLLLTPTWHPR